MRSPSLLWSQILVLNLGCRLLSPLPGDPEVLGCSSHPREPRRAERDEQLLPGGQKSKVVPPPAFPVALPPVDLCSYLQTGALVITASR